MIKSAKTHEVLVLHEKLANCEAKKNMLTALISIRSKKTHHENTLVSCSYYVSLLLFVLISIDNI